MPEAARCAWEVVAGIIPGQPIPSMTRRWGMTAAEYESPLADQIYLKRMMDAVEYAQSLQNPQQVNWVRLDWIWF
ncbi:hypothetical protein [Leptolyngbya sp. FACHB-16]|uniref:hypothetical protein n=1 Tax=unclassified Leptolyngbya TaxID=2650499 RepID=UPI001689342B|nr:hypothetical protein [Leptolyngbya sp. FACHB-16]MBD2156215.1 hypothetical protein [Leptolyngbya sp. FACHB-16]